MGKYDKIFNTQKVSKQTLSSEEAVAAVGVVTAIADSSLEDVDIDLLAEILWTFEIFEEYSDEDLLDMVDKLLAMAEDESVGVLFYTAKQFLKQEDLVLDAFGVGAATLVDEEELVIPKGKKNLLKKLQEALEINDQEAQEAIDEVIAAFEDIDSEDEDEDEEEIIPSREFDEDEQMYSSPLNNFKVPIPIDVQEGGKIQTQDGMVGFSDDFGTLLRIDYYPIPNEQAQEMKSLGQEEFLKSVVLNKYIPQAIVANLSKANVEYTEYITDELGGAYFVLVDMPKGSTIPKQENNSTASKLDAYRGLIAFSKGKFLYIVSSQHSFSNGETPGEIEEEAEDMKESILNFIDTIEFT